MPDTALTSAIDSSPRGSVWKALGPGILVAAAAVGGSHLVWSTRAGALYGWSLIGLVLLANVLKFPFFLYGQRYTAATGESLLDGYKRQGSGYVWTFFAINVLTGTINIAAVAMLTGALLSGYGLDASVPVLTVGMLVVCALLVLVGRYAVLDTLAKLVIALLTVGTLVAVALALGSAAPTPVVDVVDGPSVWTWASFGFLVSLLGWMPMPVDLSAWSSLWMFERREQTGHMATVRESSIDFYVGYGAAVVLAVLFLSLGALVMYPTGQTFSAGGVGFSNEFVALYTQTIGEWSRPLILTAAFVTMFSTTMTCVDGYPRALSACCTLLFSLDRSRFGRTHQVWVMASVVGAVVIVLTLTSSLLALLTFAAVVSFVTSPVLAWINLRVMRGANVPAAARPGPLLLAISWAGLAFFGLMTLGFLYTLLT